jgi:erythromycin esterase-like protein
VTTTVIPGVVASWVLGTCWPLAPCQAPDPQPAAQVYVQSYRTADPNNPALLEQRYQQIQNIGLSCQQKQLIENYLEQQVSSIPVNPETLTAQQRRINSAARSKIWQLRTYCP